METRRKAEAGMEDTRLACASMWDTLAGGHLMWVTLTSRFWGYVGHLSDMNPYLKRLKDLEFCDMRLLYGMHDSQTLDQLLKKANSSLYYVCAHNPDAHIIIFP